MTGAFRTESNVQDGAFLKMFIWHYEYTVCVWICFVTEICQGFEYAKDTEGSEYAWVCSGIMLQYVRPCLKQSLK